MAPRSPAPRISGGIPSAYPAREELSVSEASQKLRAAVRSFLEEAQAWGPRDRDKPTEDEDEEI